MNRYVIEGIIRDAASGKRVAVVPAYLRGADGLMGAAAEHPRASHVIRAHGRAEVRFHSGGSLRVRTADSLRGHQAEVVVLDARTGNDQRALECAVICTAPGGEVIRL